MSSTRTGPRAPSSASAAQRQRADAMVTDTRPMSRIRTLLASPVSAYYLLIGATAALVVIGLVMVPVSYTHLTLPTNREV